MGQITVILRRGNQNWIFGAFANDIKLYTKASVFFFPMKKKQLWTFIRYKIFFKPQGTIVVLHQELFYQLKKSRKDLDNCKIIVLYTHTHDTEEVNLLNLEYLKSAHKILVHSTEIKNQIIMHLGIELSKKIKVIIGGADVSYFKPLEVTKSLRSVIFVARLAKRKRPDLIIETVRSNPKFNFTLHGQDWENTQYLVNLKTYRNFAYYKFNFKNSNYLYNQNNIFLCLSDIEGGPIPALEALAAGCKVIMTDTGFARDLKNLTNSIIIIPTNPSPFEVTSALNKCLNLPNPNRNIVENFRYDHFLNELTSLIND